MEFIIVTFFLISVLDEVLGEYCYDVGRGSFYCEYGCCGETNDESCCGVHAWIIAVSVVCGFIFIAFLVCVVFCYKKKKAKSGRVVSFQNTTGVTNLSTFQSGQPNGFSQQFHPLPQPPAYHQHVNPGQPMYPPPLPQQPPYYGINKPAFPPPQY